MIQRIQSLYLIIALGLMGAMLYLPFAEIAAEDGTIYSFGSSGLGRLEGENLLRISGALPLVILIAVIAGLLVRTLSLFKRRRLQMRICAYAIILEFGLIGLGYYYFYQAFRDIQVSHYAFQLPVVFPVLSIILLYLAYRAIRKDDILVRSIDKIR